MNTSTQKVLTDEQLRAYQACRTAGRAAAARLLGNNHHGLSDVEAHLNTQLEKRLDLGELPQVPFALVVARNRALKVLRREAKHQSWDSLTSDGAERGSPESTLNSVASPAAMAELKELQMGIQPLVDALKLSLNELANRDREFLVGLVVRHNFNAKTFANELGAEPNAVSVRYHRLQQRVFVRVRNSTKDPYGASLLEYLRESGLKTCQVLKGLLRLLFEFSDSR
jgi:DNA-directed RNA polymerase specialized sigma24 family protein